MASIGPVELQIAFGPDWGDKALVELGYTISATLDDVASGQAYHEVAQLFMEGRRLGQRGVEQPVPGGTLWDATVQFTGSAVSIVRGPELLLPLAVLEQGVSPLQPDLIRARVTLTPLPPMAVSQTSNTVDVHRPPVLTA